MKLSEAKKLIQHLMFEKAGRQNATVYFTNHDLSAGTTFNTQPPTIELSRSFFMDNPPNICTDTILHELAHAIVGCKAKHGEEWKKKCVEIGAIPEKFLSYKNFPDMLMPRFGTTEEKALDAQRLPDDFNEEVEYIWK